MKWHCHEERTLNLTSENVNVTSFLGALETQLAEWQKWGEAKSQEYNQLLEAYNGYVAAHTAQAQEISSLKESQNHLAEEIEKMREAVEAKEAEISELKVQSRDASVQESSTTSKNVDQVWPLTQLFSVSFLWKIIDLPALCRIINAYSLARGFMK